MNLVSDHRMFQHIVLGRHPRISDVVAGLVGWCALHLALRRSRAWASGESVQ